MAKAKENVKRSVTINGKEYTLRKSKFTVNESPVIIHDNLTGKMSGVPGVSTSVLLNTICQERRKVNGAICQNCFAVATVERYSDLSKNCESNYHLLTESVLPFELLPRFGNVRIARIEAFADVQNETHAENYINIIKANPKVVFGWWTKNVEIVSRVLDRTGKPKNLVLIQSAMFKNRPEKARSEYVDKVFTVYTDDYIKELETVKECLKVLKGMSKKAAKAETTRIFEREFINCGGRSCVGCGKCYDTENTVKEIKERLK